MNLKLDSLHKVFIIGSLSETFIIVRDVILFKSVTAIWNKMVKVLVISWSYINDGIFGFY